MKKTRNFITIILGIIVVFSFISFFIPKAFAAQKLDWENPNKTSKNTYKFKVTDVVNSDLAMQVVGCTGVVNKVSDWMVKLAMSEKMEQAAIERLEKLARNTCRAGEKSATGAAAAIKDFMFTDVVPIIIDCQEINATKDTAAFKELVEQKKSQQKKDNLDLCFNGIAITLAKNQLTAITRSGINWINSGFGGNPLYVQSMTGLTNSIERNILESTINQTFNNPYGEAFSRTAISSYNSGGMKYGATNFLDSLGSDLAYFLTDKDSYFSGGDDSNGGYDGNSYQNTGYYGTETTKQAQLRLAQEANDRFANDFSVGGWEGWLALTQRDQNNPLGYTMLASDYLARRIEEQANETKEQVYSNGGFLNQKKCIEWQQYLEDGIPDEELVINDDGSSSFVPIYNDHKVREFDKCTDWDTVTPGSIIKEKLTMYVNSPERQLELADTINESLNAVFSLLVSKLQSNGLPGLSSGDYAYEDESFNWVDDSNEGFLSSRGSGSYSTNIDLTKDLGNIYYYDERESVGTWNAKLNIPKLASTLGPYDPLSKSYPPHRYYTVTVPGNTEIIRDGYNGWGVGDRVYWDGTKWQNWKKDQANPIKKRGIIQIQKDYVVAAKEALKFLPSVMPKMGELDYCIPGPNPNYKSNSADAQNAYIDWISSLNSVYEKGSLFKRDTDTFTIGGYESDVYQAWANIFNDIKSVWNDLTETDECGEWAGYQNGIGLVCWPRNLGDGTIPDDDQAEKRQKWIDKFSYYINSVLFPGFYKEFDPLMDRLYFDKMTNPYLETENSSYLEDNPAYIPMAEEGYGITKNILTYDEDINEAIANYNRDVNQANINVGKLEAIRKEVGLIVNAAQERRNTNLLKILNEETARQCGEERDSCLSGVGVPPEVLNDIGEYCLAKYNLCIKDNITEAEYKEKYKDCLDEEDILYYDDTYIMSATGDDEALRCTDKLDNDLDGLADERDPDCKDSNGGNGTTYIQYGCSIDRERGQDINTEIQQNDHCSSRTEDECLEEPYYHLKVIEYCKWTPEE